MLRVVTVGERVNEQQGPLYKHSWTLAHNGVYTFFLNLLALAVAGVLLNLERFNRSRRNPGVSQAAG